MTRSLTARESEILAAWWKAKGSVKVAAQLLDIKPQSLRNQLYTMRRMQGAATNLDLVLRFGSTE